MLLLLTFQCKQTKRRKENLTQNAIYFQIQAMIHCDDYVVGSCEDMCPASEIALRTKNNLVHFYERKFLVKEFSRSAADKRKAVSSDLRTFNALQNTLEYLFNKWVWKCHPFPSSWRRTCRASCFSIDESKWAGSERWHRRVLLPTLRQ